MDLSKERISKLKNDKNNLMKARWDSNTQNNLGLYVLKKNYTTNWETKENRVHLRYTNQ